MTVAKSGASANDGQRTCGKSGESERPEKASELESWSLPLRELLPEVDPTIGDEDGMEGLVYGECFFAPLNVFVFRWIAGRLVGVVMMGETVQQFGR